MPIMYNYKVEIPPLVLRISNSHPVHVTKAKFLIYSFPILYHSNTTVLDCL